MKSLTLVLSYLFSGLHMIASVLVFPLTILCALGILIFTIKIARDMRSKEGYLTSVGELDRLEV